MGIPTHTKETRHCAHMGKVSYFSITGRHRQVMILHNPQRGLPHQHMLVGILAYYKLSIYIISVRHHINSSSLG